MKIFSYLLKNVPGIEARAAPEKTPRIRSTLASRMINPELYIKPNKHVMSIGVALLAGCVMYMVYMFSIADPKKNPKKEKTFSIKTGQASNRNKWD